MNNACPRVPEAELMDGDEDAAYVRADFSEVNAAFVARLLEVAGKRVHSNAIDLGAGPGDIALRVARARPEWTVTAFDLSSVMIDTARQVTRDASVTNVQVLQGNAADTKLPAHSFDVIFTNSLLHHVGDAPQLWREIKRLAAPGAAIFLRDLFRPESVERARELVELHTAGHSPQQKELFFRSLLAAYTPDEVRAQVAGAGLSLRVATVTDRHVDAFTE